MAEMQEYTNNSYKYKQEQKKKSSGETIEKKKIEKVVTGSVKTRKKSEGSKLTSMIIAEDLSNVKNYIITDVLIPAVKKTIYDILTNGLDMTLFGGTGHGGRKSSPTSSISYNKYYDRRDPIPISQPRSTYSYDEVVLETRGEADLVLNQMDDILDEYKVVSVADFYDLVGITGRYTDNNYGWKDLRSAQVVRARGGGYMIKLPRAIPLD